MGKLSIALQVKYKRMKKEELEAALNNPETPEEEKELAQKYLDKLAENTEEVSEASKELETPKEKTTSNQESVDEEKPKKPMKKAVKKEPLLSEEDAERLEQAEKDFDERQKNRKSNSKKEKPLRKEKADKPEKEPRETKRQNLEESVEKPGLKVGSEVTLKGAEEKGVVTRLYVSGDGKEKCMVKFGDEKPIKKRVSALELIK